ncbi:MAG: PEP-CTERM sorting domain-containing protein [Geobacteraceae bacterium]|nr:PEP-CTERM sorting domain-containing protein [Geobacteraceae bacterium]
MKSMLTKIMLTTAFLSILPIIAFGYTYNLGTTFSNTVNPDGSGPWLTINITDAGANTVTLDIQGNMVDMPNTDPQKINDIYLNFSNTSLLSNLNFTFVSGQFGAESISLSSNAYKADGVGGYFDILMQWRSNRPIDGTDHIVYSITAAGLTAAMFNDTCVNYGTPPGPLHAAAHLQNAGFDSFGRFDSTWIGDIPDDPPNPVPEPGTLVLLGAGFLGLAAYGRKRASR